MVFGVMGKGRCAMGCFEVLERLPIKVVDPSELKSLHDNKNAPEHKN